MATDLLPDDGRLLLLDGSFSTELRQDGFESDSHALWTAAANVEAGESVKNVYTRFLESGVDLLTTNTYHATLPQLKAHYGDEIAEESIKNSVEWAIQEIERVRPSCHLLGSIASYGATRRDASEYTGEFVDDEDGVMKKMVAYHDGQVAVLLSAGVRHFLFETVPALAELDAVLTVVKQRRLSSIVVSFSCRDDTRLRHGEPFRDALQRIIDGDPSQLVKAVGVNCSDFRHVSNLLASCSDAAARHRRPFLVYPNFERQFDKPTASWITVAARPDERLLFSEWRRLGVRVIGGCCGVSAQRIAEFRRVIDELNDAQDRKAL